MTHLCAMETFTALGKQIQDLIQDLSLLGFKRIMTVCTAITAHESLPFASVHHWSTCSLSGINSNRLANNLIQVGTDAHSVLIDASYSSFASMLWLTTHMRDLECSRTHEFLNQVDAGLSIGDTINQYYDKTYAQNEEIVNTYYSAFQTVIQVLQTTLQESVQASDNTSQHSDHA